MEDFTGDEVTALCRKGNQMTENYRPSVGDVVRSTEYARTQKFFNGGKPPRGKRVVLEVRHFDDVLLDNGEVWNACWLELVND